jgi:hypothetical protein
MPLRCPRRSRSRLLAEAREAMRLSFVRTHPGICQSSQALFSIPFDPPPESAGSARVGTCQPFAWVTPSRHGLVERGESGGVPGLFGPSFRAVSGTGGSVRTSALPSERNQSHHLPLSLSHHSQPCQNAAHGIAPCPCSLRERRSRAVS